MSDRPNIVFLLTDDQRFDTIHALGNEEIITPNMDRLVENGTSFTQAHIPGGTSAAVCMPSRAMINTGRTLFHICKEGQQIADNHVTLGEIFRKSGYRTFGAGKWHNGTASYSRSFSGGGNIFFGGMWDHWNVPLCDYDPAGKFDNIMKFTYDFFHCNHPMEVHCDHFSMGRHSTEVISETAIDFITNYNSEEPFLLYAAFLAPHDPRTMPKKFRGMYDPAKINLPENFMEEHPFNYGVSEIRDELLASSPRSREEIKVHIAEYYAMITHLDHEIGRVLDALEKSGKASNTIIVLASDNGLAVGRHGLMGKQSLYEHSIRVPLIFSGPGVPKNLKVDSYVYLLDIYPTLCELTGIEIPESVEGHSLVPMMNNPEVCLRSSLYFAYTDLIRAVKSDRFKLIEYAGWVRKTQLFDLENDPCELNNLFENPQYEKIVENLRKELFIFRDEWEDESHPLGKSFWDNYML